MKLPKFGKKKAPLPAAPVVKPQEPGVEVVRENLIHVRVYSDRAPVTADNLGCTLLGLGAVELESVYSNTGSYMMDSRYVKLTFRVK